MTVDRLFRNGVGFLGHRIGDLASREGVIRFAGQEQHDPEFDDAHANRLTAECLPVRHGRSCQDAIARLPLVFHFPEIVNVPGDQSPAISPRRSVPGDQSPAISSRGSNPGSS